MNVRTAENAKMLKDFRLRSGLSQDQLASRLNIDRAIISRIETGKIVPVHEIVVKWAEVTNSAGLLASHIGGENWRKQSKLESAIREARELLSVNFMRKKKAN